jgi:hypothetical protein
VKLGACAEGYKPWFYADPSNPSRPVALELRPGAEFEIEINLEHGAENMQVPCVSGGY